MADKDVDVATTEPTTPDRIGGDLKAAYGGFFDPAAPIPKVNTAKWRIRLAALVSFPSWIVGFYVLGIMVSGQLPTPDEETIPLTFQAPLPLLIILIVVALGLPVSAILSLFLQRFWTVWAFCGFGAIIVAFRLALFFAQPPEGLPGFFLAVIFVLWTLVLAFAILHALRSQMFLDQYRAAASANAPNPPGVG